LYPVPERPREEEDPCRSEGGILLEVGGVADHVHLVVKLKPVLAVATALRVIKSNSSRWVNDTAGRNERFEWQTGYAAFSVSESQVEAVRRYGARGPGTRCRPVGAPGKKKEE
jgi:REP element-mobilizing transposase RayT